MTEVYRMLTELHCANWLKAKNSEECTRLVNEHFDFDGVFAGRAKPEKGLLPIFRDQNQLLWVLVPGGDFTMGISAAEIAAAMELSDSPFLTFEEMQPCHRLSMSAFLMLQEPISAKFAKRYGVVADDIIGPNAIGLFDYETIKDLPAQLGGLTPTEAEWEYACRGGTQSLFWFGDDLPYAGLPQILGLDLPLSHNDFGLTSLFHGEWCIDTWRPNYAVEPVSREGCVVRGGGASRFWPWQDDREWAGCISAYRMSARDTCGYGAALRLVKHLKTPI